MAQIQGKGSPILLILAPINNCFISEFQHLGQLTSTLRTTTLQIAFFWTHTRIIESVYSMCSADTDLSERMRVLLYTSSSA